MRYSKSSTKIEVHINTSLRLRNKRAIRLHNLTLHIKQVEQKEQQHKKGSRRKEIMKIKAEIERK